jgi:uncharacterized HAD superfamily protein
MTKPVLGIDFDDVVYDFNGGYIAWHNKKYGTTVTYENLSSHDMAKVWRVPIETVWQRVDEFHRELDEDSVPLMPGAQLALKLLKERYQLEIITARSLSIKEKTYACLRALDIEVFSAVHFTNEYDPHPDYETRSKLAICEEIGAVALIEDAPRNAAAVAPHLPVYLPDRPWNRTEEIPNVERVYSWEEILEKLL